MTDNTEVIIENTTVRPDLQRIQEWIAPDSRLLDLACGDGTLLALLAETKGTSGYGMEISQPDINACLKKGYAIRHRPYWRWLELASEASCRFPTWDTGAHDYQSVYLAKCRARDHCHINGMTLRIPTCVPCVILKTCVSS